MPSPFPGMDPYLEHPAIWLGVHQRCITYVGDALDAVLPAHYIADIGERLYIIQPERSIDPDVAILEHPSARPPMLASRRAEDTVWADQVLRDQQRHS
jgi:Protein of unknown function (DUF4058)